MRVTNAAWVACLATIGILFTANSLMAQRAALPTGVHGCLRVDVEKTTEVMRVAMEKGGDAMDDVQEVQREIDGCTYYTITFVSSVTVVSDAPAAGSRKISGRGAITFGLTADMSEPGFDLTSGPADLTAPIFWSGAAITPGNNCTVTIVPMPFTAFSFWLGVKGGTDPNVSVQVTPAGDELHATRTKCPHPAGGRSIEVPGRDMIFTPAWMALHGTGTSAAAQVGIAPQAMMDVEKMKAAAQQQPPMMDMKKLQALADKANGKELSPADMMAMMKEIVPNAQAQVEAARNNFMLTMPGDCVSGGGGVFRCSVARTVRLPDGKGTTQNITESTEITIAPVRTPAAVPATRP